MTPASDTLEAALDKIALDNNLTSVRVGRMSVGDRVLRVANVHWDGFSRDGIPCAHADSDTSIHEAIERVLAKAAADRTPLPVAPPVLPAFDAPQIAEAA